MERVSDHTQVTDKDLQRDANTGLMQLPNELLVRTIRMQPIDPSLLELFKCLKLTNKRLCNLLLHEILDD